MGLSRDLLRIEAKRAYKEQIKNVPKRSRMPFSDFYKQFKRMKANNAIKEEHAHDHEVNEDFDVEQVVNVNKVVDPVMHDLKEVNNPAPAPVSSNQQPSGIRRQGHK